MFYIELPTVCFRELWNIKIGNVSLFFLFIILLIIVRFYYHPLHGVSIFMVFLTSLSR
jgi:hypothetical protein